MQVMAALAAAGRGAFLHLPVSPNRAIVMRAIAMRVIAIMPIQTSATV